MAQTTSKITGTVQDESGAPIPGTSIKIKAEELLSAMRMVPSLLMLPKAGVSSLLPLALKQKK
jgi:hypothetical protein